MTARYNYMMYKSHYIMGKPLYMHVASKPVCDLTSYKLRSCVLTSSLKLSVLCERLAIKIVISGLPIVNHGFRFR